MPNETGSFWYALHSFTIRFPVSACPPPAPLAPLPKGFTATEGNHARCDGCEEIVKRPVAGGTPLDHICLHYF